MDHPSPPVDQKNRFIVTGKPFDKEPVSPQGPRQPKTDVQRLLQMGHQSFHQIDFLLIDMAVGRRPLYREKP